MPNPGGICRWSFVVDKLVSAATDLGKSRWEFFGSMTGEITDPPRTNNQAELTAVLKAIRYMDGLMQAELMEAKEALSCPISFCWIPRDENSRADSIMR